MNQQQPLRSSSQYSVCCSSDDRAFTLHYFFSFGSGYFCVIDWPVVRPNTHIKPNPSIIKFGVHFHTSMNWTTWNWCYWFITQPWFVLSFMRPRACTQVKPKLETKSQIGCGIEKSFEKNYCRNIVFFFLSATQHTHIHLSVYINCDVQATILSFPW